MTNSDATTPSPTYTVSYGMNLDDRGVPGSPKPGDLHYDRYVPSERRVLMSVPNQPSREDASVRGPMNLYVTHVFDGESWQPADGGTMHIVLQVPVGVRGSLQISVYRAINHAIVSSPAGRYLDDTGRRSITDSVLSALGLPQSMDEDWSEIGVVDTTGMHKVQKAIEELLSYAPETGYPEGLGAIGAANDGVGFAKDGEEYQNLIDGKTDGWGEKTPKGEREPMPFFSDPVYYAALGWKDNGRSLKARIRNLCEAAGMDGDW